jgi:hypothetical protein
MNSINNQIVASTNPSAMLIAPSVFVVAMMASPSLHIVKPTVVFFSFTIAASIPVSLPLTATGNYNSMAMVS